MVLAGAAYQRDTNGTEPCQAQWLVMTLATKAEQFAQQPDEEEDKPPLLAPTEAEEPVQDEVVVEGPELPPAPDTGGVGVGPLPVTVAGDRNLGTPGCATPYRSVEL